MVGCRLAVLLCLVFLRPAIAENVAVLTNEQRSQDRPIENYQIDERSSQEEERYGDAAHPSANHSVGDGGVNGNSEQDAAAVGSSSSSGGALVAKTRTTFAVGDEAEEYEVDPLLLSGAKGGIMADPNDAAGAAEFEEAELEEAERTAEFVDPEWDLEDGDETLPHGGDEPEDSEEEAVEEEIVDEHDDEEGWDLDDEDEDEDDDDDDYGADEEDAWAEEEEVDKRKQRLADDALLKEETMRMNLKDSKMGAQAHFHTPRRVRAGEAQVAGSGEIDEVDFLLRETEMRSTTDGTKAVLRARKEELPPETQVDESLPVELQKETRMRSSLRSAVRKTPQQQGQQRLARFTRKRGSPRVAELKRAAAAGSEMEERIDFLLKETEMRSATDGTKAVLRARKEELPPETQVDESLPVELQKETRMRSSLRSAVRKTPQQQGQQGLARFARPSEHTPQLTHTKDGDNDLLQQEKDALLKETAMRSAVGGAQTTLQNSREAERSSGEDAAQHADELLEKLNKKYSGGGGAAGATVMQRQAATPAPRRPSPSHAPAKAAPQPNPFNLPSFESTPVPSKPSLWQWQEGYQAGRGADARTHAARLRGDEGVGPPLHPSISAPHAYEFTSREFLGPNRPPPGYVAACLVARDAHDDVGEWVHHHLKLGIGPIYVYDHASIPPMDSVLKHWISAGAVVYEKLATPERGERPQLVGYGKCLKDHGEAHRWLTFFDADEYLVFTDDGGYGVPPVQSLPVLLKRYEQYSALAVHWVLFGSSGRAVRPSRGALRSYLHCLPANHTHHLYVKTIANTRCTVAPSDTPHAFKHNCSRPAVRTNFAPVEGQTAADLPVYSKLALLHYATRSQEEFEIKMARGSGMKRQRGWEYFAFVDNWSVDFCLQGLRGWDDNTITLPRTLDPGSLQKQLESYAREEHEDFWGARAAANLAKAAAAQRAEEAGRWGKDEGEDEEYELEYEADEDGESEGRDEWRRRQQRRRKLNEFEGETAVGAMEVAANAIAKGDYPFLEAVPN